jgi:hypothetical protein
MRTDVVALGVELNYREAVKLKLLEMCPDLADDDQALLDTLDGETNVDEILTAMARAAKEREAAAKACAELAATYAERSRKHKAAQESLKRSIIWGMEKANKTKIKHAHVSLSWRPLEDKINIVCKEPELSPDCFTTTKSVVSYDMEKIEKNLQDAIDMGIVVIEYDRKSLTIRV